MKCLIYLFFAFLTTISPLEGYTEIDDRATLPLLTPSLASQETLKMELENGLQAYLISDPNAAQSGAALVVGVGSWEDGKETPGIAHFLEHMLFLGTKTYPNESEYSHFIAEHAGRSNAYTASDRTAYMFSADHSAFPEALDRFSRFFHEPLFNPSGVARELNAINQEYAKNVENDNIREYYVHKALADTNHPHHGFSMGNKESLSGVSRETLIEWYQRNYSAQLMRLIITSSLPVEELAELVEKDFGSIPKTKKNRSKFAEGAFTKELSGKFLYIDPIKNIRRLTLIWELPPRFAKMDESKPEDLVCYVLGDEGQTSLLAQLKREKLAEALNCGSIRLSPDHMTLHMQIDLTKKGLRQRDRVLLRIFQTIAAMRSEGIPRYLFDERQEMGQLNYQYQPRKKEFEMLMFHTQNITTESFETYPERTAIIEKYDPEAISDLLGELRPETCHVDIIAPMGQVGIEPTAKEKWLGVDYAIEPMPKGVLGQLQEAQPSPKITIPPPNPFIPKKVSPITEKDTSKKFPAPTLENGNGKIFYAKDHYYHVPKVSLYFELKTPEVLAGNATQAALADIYVKAVEEILNPISYPALTAGLKYEIKQEKNGISFTIDGYSDNAGILFEKVVGALGQVKLTRERFRQYKESLLRKYKNFAMEMPIEQVIELFKKVLYKDFTTHAEKASAIRRTSVHSFNQFAAELFDQVLVQGVVYGDVSGKEAADWAMKLREHFAESAPYPTGEQLVIKVVELPESEGPFSVVQKTPAQGNALLLCVESPEFSFESHAAEKVLMQAIRQPFFATLRTRQQTGYIVHSTSEAIRDHQYNIFMVQSNSHQPEELLGRFELFIEGFLQELDKGGVSEEKFNNIKNALIEEWEELPKNMPEMVEKLKKLAFDEGADFSRPEKEVAALRELTYERFLEISLELLGRHNRRRAAILLKGQIPEDKVFQYTPLKRIEKLKEVSGY